jgi:sugar transferase (PEP-CTERM/EpsH1 system associated)
MRHAPRVVHVIQHLAMGGMENGIVNLINGTPRERLSHYSDFRQRIRDPEVPVLALGKRAGKDLGSYWRLWRALRELAPDIVHSRNLPAVDCAPIARAAGAAAHIHGEHGWDVHDLHGAQRKYQRYRRWMRPFVSRYVAVSRDIAQWLVTRVGIPADQIEQIYNGVDTARFVQRTAAEARHVELPFAADANTVLIGTVGRLQPVKNPLLLARAFALLVKRSPQNARRARLAMVGDGPLRAEVMRLLSEQGVAELAWLPGAREDVPQVMRSFDVFALPSLNEGISNGILEAMASGLPVVATAVGGNGELVMENESGRLFPSDDLAGLVEALQYYLDDAEARRSHGQNARQRAVSTFSLDTMIARYLALYETVGRAPRAAA